MNTAEKIIVAVLLAFVALAGINGTGKAQMERDQMQDELAKEAWQLDTCSRELTGYKEIYEYNAQYGCGSAYWTNTTGVPEIVLLPRGTTNSVK